MGIIFAHQEGKQRWIERLNSFTKSLGPEKMQTIKDWRKGANCLRVSRIFAPPVSDLEERVFSVAWRPFLLYFSLGTLPFPQKDGYSR